jgi:hypothetical protein
MGWLRPENSPGATVHLLRFSRTAKVAQGDGLQAAQAGNQEEAKGQVEQNKEHLQVFSFPPIAEYARYGAPCFICCGLVKSVGDGFALK